MWEGGRTSAKPIREVKGYRMSRDLAPRRGLLAPLCLRGAEVIDGLKQNTIAKSIPLFRDGWTRFGKTSLSGVVPVYMESISICQEHLGVNFGGKIQH